MICDRGFASSILDVEELGFEMKIPALKKRKELGQLSTSDANHTRLVTKVRWIIEQGFGRLKKRFRFFDLAAHNSALEYDFKVIQIGFALLNMFFTPILSDLAHPNIPEDMLSRLNKENKLIKLVEDHHLLTVRVPFKKLDDDTHSIQRYFPQLYYNDLYRISLGPYQIRNAVSYYALHTADTEGIFFVYEFKPSSNVPVDYAKYDIDVIDPILVKAKMDSRFRSNKLHHLFVLADRAKTGHEAIVEYYCKCDSGARTVGCCSHVMTVIWYLSYAHYRPINLPNPKLVQLALNIP